MSTASHQPSPSEEQSQNPSRNIRAIPIPLHQRWHDARLRVFPALAFCAAIAAIVLLWKSNIAAPTLVGQAEPNEAKVSCYKPGMLAQLDVARFQKIKAG